MDDFPEFETYAEVIDAYEKDNMGYATLTDYIKGENIKIKEIDISPLSDLKNMKNGGPVGIEILFTEKVPAAPSQLVSESDIILGYRGDAAYRSGSAQASSIGQGNVGSKASFGGGKGVDRSGRDEGAGGADRSKITQEQNINQLKNQLGIKDPNLIQKTFNIYNQLPFAVKGAINTMAPVELMKLFNIGNAINTGVNQMKNPDITEEDVTLGIDNLRTEVGKQDIKASKMRGFKNMDYDTYKTIMDMKGGTKITPFEFEGLKKGTITEPGTYTAKDGGRVGLFMGGPALEGTALNIYNSMNAYGFSDQEIANALQERGLYTPPGSDSGTPPPQASQTLGFQGDDKPMIQPFRKDPRVDAAFEAYQRNQQLQSMSIEDPFADEISLQGAYYGDMPDVNLSPGKQTFMGKMKSGIGEIMNFPLVKGMSLMSPFGLVKKGLTALKDKLPVNQRAIAENIGGNMGIAVDDIGRIVNTGDYQDPSNIMAGYNLNQMTDETFDKRIDRTSKTLSEKYKLDPEQIKGILEGTLSEKELADINARAIMPGTTQTTNLIKQLRSLNIAKDRNRFIQDVAKKEAERQRAERAAKELEKQRARTREADTAAGAFDDRVRLDPGGGGTFKQQTAAKERQGVQVAGPGFGKGAYFAEGGLATMFRNKR